MRNFSTIAKRAFRTISGKWKGYALLLLVVAAITLTLYIFFFWLDASARLATQARTSTEACILLQSNDRQQIGSLPQAMREHPAVKGSDTTTLLTASPVNFVNAVSRQDSPFDLPGESDQVLVSAHTDIAMSDAFRTGNASLVEGAFPTGSDPQVVIEDVLAKRNGLQIGDSISMSLSLPGYTEPHQLNLRVCGIYHLQQPIEATYYTSDGTPVYGASPYSSVFVPFDTLAVRFPDALSQDSVCFYLTDFTVISSVLEQFRQLNPDPARYTLSDFTDYRYEQLLQASQAVGRLILAAVWIFIGMELLILFFAILSILRSYYKDAGILIALGERRRCVAAQFLFQILVVGVVAVSVTLVGAFLLTPLLATLASGQIVHTAAETLPGNAVEIGAIENMARLLEEHGGNFAMLYASIAVLSVLVLLGLSSFFLFSHTPTRRLFDKE